MSSGKEIRSQIKSIQNTQKITRAMEMVAASKMRKAQDRMAAARPYADKIRHVISHLVLGHPEYEHPYMLDRDGNRVGFIIVSSDRGLCGGLNTNLFKATLAAMREWRDQGKEIEFCALGQKAGAFFGRLGANIVARATHLGDAPSVVDLIGSIQVMLDAYNQNRINRLFLIYNEFVNTMTQRPTVLQLLPLKPLDPSECIPHDWAHHWDYIYEPDAKEVLDELLTRYIESLVYHGVVENLACEQASRMVAMKSASDNAGELIGELQLMYNKARQAAITQELSEIVGGAAAV